MHHKRTSDIEPLTGSGGSGHTLRHMIAPWEGGSRALWVGETILQPGASTKATALAGCESAHVTLEGSGIEIIEGERASTGPGSFVHIPEGAMHQVVNTGAIPLRLITMSTPPPPAPPRPEGAA